MSQIRRSTSARSTCGRSIAGRSTRCDAMRLRSILCGVDFSNASRQALRAAAELARANDSRLIVLFADDPMLVAAAKAAHDTRGSAHSTAAALDRFIADTVRPLP